MGGMNELKEIIIAVIFFIALLCFIHMAIDK